MIRILRVRRKLSDSIGLYYAAPIYKNEFETPEEARDYYQEMYRCKILLDYETIK